MNAPRPGARIALGALLLTAAAFAAGPAWRERAAGAPLQIVGRCESRQSRWEDGAIYSYNEVSVRRVIRGEAGPTVVVRQHGGIVDGIGQKVSNVRLLEPAQTYLLFLVRDETSAWAATSRGVHPIGVGADGSEEVGGEPLASVIAEIGEER